MCNINQAFDIRSPRFGLQNLNAGTASLTTGTETYPHSAIRLWETLKIRFDIARMVTIGGQGEGHKLRQVYYPLRPWVVVIVGLALLIGMGVEVHGFVDGCNGLRSQVKPRSLKMGGNVGLQMALNPELSKRFPRDFKKVRGLGYASGFVLLVVMVILFLVPI